MASSSATSGTTVVARLRQGVSAIVARRRRAMLPDRFRGELPEPILALWSRLPSYDQHHLLAVAEDLRHSGARNHVVLAGLLHDIGKAGRITLPHRMIAVLVIAFAPGLGSRLRRAHRPWPGLEGLHLLLNHAERGADLLWDAGLPHEVVWLVRHHDSNLPHPELTALQAADHRN